MIGLLNPKLLSPTSEPKVQAEVDLFSETHTIRSTANSGASTVDDYLKRLGY